ncbi:Protein of unknown function [Bradyrhizobium sp. ORS 285]|uniref:hypothetical protein n=1 Tax=Bradyrhizobium sp. ORS 285 TaxID=115808 RepID=UPI000240896B|nr:hypothetical protein [Bradyrhizobium sp. ORS 285]CCD85097.1 Protein of unknown function [Bradyrhizobium sp. ORS 285]SMX58462.1 Protein of unknown function [Bradyrhizobium sp. ORS 285]
MQEAEKSNVVQFRDYAPRLTGRSGSDRANVSAGERGAVLTWPRAQAAYPGGIDDLPV